MPRRKRLCLAGIPQHIIQRGNNRQTCFTTDHDVAAYANWLAEAAVKYKVAIHAWVFMRNHVHLLVTPRRDGGISAMMQQLGRHYVRYFNTTHERSGTLWEGRFRSCLVQSETYLLVCHRYIELNPVRAGMVADPAEYKWSSYRANGLGLESRLITYHPVYLSLGKSKLERIKRYRKFFASEIDKEMLSDIRYATNNGLLLGTNKFESEIKILAGNHVLPRNRGPKPRSC